MLMTGQVTIFFYLLELLIKDTLACVSIDNHHHKKDNFDKRTVLIYGLDGLHIQSDDIMNPTRNLNVIESILDSNSVLNRSKDYVNKGDYVGSVNLLEDIREVYKLEVKDLAEGYINSSSNPSRKTYVEKLESLTASECWSIGLILYSHDNYVIAIEWFAQTLFRLTPDDLDVVETEVIEHIIFCYIGLDDIYKFKQWVLRLYMFNPEKVDARIVAFERRLRKIESSGEELDDEHARQSIRKSITTEAHQRWSHNYHSHCRGEVDVPEGVKKNLHCRYMDNHPFLKLAPIKAEELYLDPQVLLLHEVLYEKEINNFIGIARPLIDSKQLLYEKKDSIGRLCKLCWISHNHNKLTTQVLRRTAAFTGLDLKYAEQFQVAKYGTGGVYMPHYDSGDTLSDVVLGGATVFTKLGLTVYPTKGSALYWNNLVDSGLDDWATKHAGCPVLYKNKWFVNLWIKAKGQELLRPNTIERHKFSYLRKIPHPVAREGSGKVFVYSGGDFHA